MFPNKRITYRGFTIVETMISVAFISLLLIAVGTVSLHIVNTYRRGVAIKMVNEVGRSIGEDFRASISSGGVDLERDYFTTSGYGVLCTGEYTYLWNYARALMDQNNNSIVRYKETSGHVGGNDDQIRMIKILDRSRSYCVNRGDDSLIKNGIDKPTKTSGDSKVIEIIKPSEGSLMIYDFNVTKGSNSSAANLAIYQLSFSLGTFQYEDIIKGGGQCVSYSSDPSTSSTKDVDPIDCAINRFDVSILTKER